MNKCLHEKPENRPSYKRIQTVIKNLKDDIDTKGSSILWLKNR